MRYHAQDDTPSSDPLSCGEIVPSVILLIALRQLSMNSAIRPLLEQHLIAFRELGRPPG